MNQELQHREDGQHEWEERRGRHDESKEGSWVQIGKMGR